MTPSTASLIRLAKNGDEQALERIISENTGLVKSIAVRFLGRGVDFEDLCQLGHIGMLKAVRNFDLERGTEFSTYAVPLIIGEIKRFLRDDGSIKIGRELKRKSALILSARERFIAETGNEPQISELAKICDMTSEEITESISAGSSIISLSEQYGDMTIEDTIGLDCIPELNEKIALRQALSKLCAEDRTLILFRYYKGLSQAETGLRMGITQVMVSRRESKILHMLKKHLE